MYSLNDYEDMIMKELSDIKNGSTNYVSQSKNV